MSLKRRRVYSQTRSLDVRITADVRRDEWDCLVSDAMSYLRRERHRLPKAASGEISLHTLPYYTTWRDCKCIDPVPHPGEWRSVKIEWADAKRCETPLAILRSWVKHPIRNLKLLLGIPESKQVSIDEIDDDVLASLTPEERAALAEKA